MISNDLPDDKSLFLSSSLIAFSGGLNLISSVPADRQAFEVLPKKNRFKCFPQNFYGHLACEPRNTLSKLGISIEVACIVSGGSL